MFTALSKSRYVARMSMADYRFIFFPSLPAATVEGPASWLRSQDDIRHNMRLGSRTHSLMTLPILEKDTRVPGVTHIEKVTHKGTRPSTNLHLSRTTWLRVTYTGQF